jgi:hypothetical protein
MALLQPRSPLDVGQAGEVLAVAVQQVEAEQAHRHLQHRLGDAVLAAPVHHLLEGAQLTGGGVGGQHLALQDRPAWTDARPQHLHDVGELGGYALQAAAERLQPPVAGAVGLHPDAVVLVLGGARPTQLVQEGQADLHAGGVRRDLALAQQRHRGQQGGRGLGEQPGEAVDQPKAGAGGLQVAVRLGDTRSCEACGGGRGDGQVSRC